MKVLFKLFALLGHTLTIIGAFGLALLPSPALAAIIVVRGPVHHPAGGGGPTPIAHWKMDEASGDLVPFVGSITLTDTNTVGATTGKDGGARSFTAASSEYFTSSSAGAVATLSEFTVTCWVNVGSSPVDFMGILGTGNTPGWAMIYRSSSVWRFQMNTGDHNHSATTATDTWYFLAWGFTDTGNQTFVKVNNGLPSFATETESNNGSATIFQIGRNPITASGYWNGAIDDVRIYNSYLTDAELNTIYASYP